MSSHPLLEVDHLSVRFGTSTVVNDVSFSIAAGEKFALVGESGSGKKHAQTRRRRAAADAGRRSR
jgi:microcin C transport system ATP-binding protein